MYLGGASRLRPFFRLARHSRHASNAGLASLMGDALAWEVMHRYGEGMSTTKPRITITLEPHHHELLQRMAAHQGQSMSSIVVELVESVAPVLERVCAAVEAAKKAQAGVKENLVRVAEDSERAALPHLEAVMGQLDALLTTFHQAGEGASLGKNAKSSSAPVAAPRRRASASDEHDVRRGVGAAGAKKDPRPVITGVRVIDGSHSRRRKGHAV